LKINKLFTRRLLCRCPMPFLGLLLLSVLDARYFYRHSRTHMRHFYRYFRTFTRDTKRSRTISERIKILYLVARCIYLIHIYFGRHSRFRYERKSHFTYENHLRANRSGIQRYLRTRVKSETEENYRLMESMRMGFTRLLSAHNLLHSPFVRFRTWSLSFIYLCCAPDYHTYMRPTV